MKKVTIGVLVTALIVVGYFLFVKGIQSSDYVHDDFSDVEENVSEEQDVVSIVSKSIVGKYQNTTDSNFVREFKSDGSLVDMYGTEVVSSGVWEIFTSESGLSAGMPRVPLIANTAYIQLRMSGDQNENLNFKISKLTPEGLDLVYMERGGVLMFTRVN